MADEDFPLLNDEERRVNNDVFEKAQQALEHDYALRSREDDFLDAQDAESAERDKKNKAKIAKPSLLQDSPKWVERMNGFLEKKAQKGNWRIGCTADRQPFAYQLAAAEIFSPRYDPNVHLAVLFGTGAGKTMVMALQLNAYFKDPRPKILIFPTETIRRQFYDELASTSNKYTELYEKAVRKRPSEAVAYKEWLRGFDEWLQMKGRLHNKGKKNDLFSPVRTFTYTTAAPKNWEKEAILKYKVGSQSPQNPFDLKIILMDEGHMIEGDKEDKGIQVENRARAKKCLSTCRNSAVAMFTATPSSNLLEIVKGTHTNPDLYAYTIYYQNLVAEIYPPVYIGNRQINPINDMCICEVPLVGNTAKSYTLQMTDKKKTKCELPTQGGKLDLKACARLQTYTSTTEIPRNMRKKKAEFTDSTAPKLAWLRRFASESSGKTAVLIHRGSPTDTQAIEAAADLLPPNTFIVKAKEATQADKTRQKQQLDAFNAIPANENAVILLDAKDNYKGVNLRDVKTLIIFQPMLGWEQMKQGFGRVLRSCLNRVNLQVNIITLVATHPMYYTADELLLRHMILERNTMEPEERKMAENGLGANMLKQMSQTNDVVDPSPTDDIRLHLKDTEDYLTGTEYVQSFAGVLGKGDEHGEQDDECKALKKKTCVDPCTFGKFGDAKVGKCRYEPATKTWEAFANRSMFTKQNMMDMASSKLDADIDQLADKVKQIPGPSPTESCNIQ